MSACLVQAGQTNNRRDLSTHPIRVCGADWSRHNNIENPELYAIFPYKLITLASNASDVAIGKTSYAKRVSHGDTSEWQDCIQAALLGMVGEAEQLVLGRLDRGAAQMRFPGFCESHATALGRPSPLSF